MAPGVEALSGLPPPPAIIGPTFAQLLLIPSITAGPELFPIPARAVLVVQVRAWVVLVPSVEQSRWAIVMLPLEEWAFIMPQFRVARLLVMTVVKLDRGALPIMTMLTLRGGIASGLRFGGIAGGLGYGPLPTTVPNTWLVPVRLYDIADTLLPQANGMAIKATLEGWTLITDLVTFRTESRLDRPRLAANDPALVLSRPNNPTGPASILVSAIPWTTDETKLRRCRTCRTLSLLLRALWVWMNVSVLLLSTARPFVGRLKCVRQLPIGPLR